MAAATEKVFSPGRWLKGFFKSVLFAPVPVRSYWLVAGYFCFLLFLFLFRQTALLLGEKGFWLFLAVAVVGSYAVFLVHPFLPERWRGVIQLVLYLAITTYLLLDTDLNAANALMVMSIGVIMAAFWFGLRGAVVLGVFQSVVTYVVFDQPPVARWAGPRADFLEALAALWLMAMFAGLVAELFHEKIRENERLRQVVERQERLGAMGEMVGGLAHELRNPLLIIKSAAELIRDGADAAESTELAEYIGGEVNRLNGLLTALLDFAKPETMVFASLNVHDPLGETVEQARLMVAGSKKKIVVHFSGPDKLTVTGDAMFLKQAFLNLLLNAVEAIPETGQIWVASGREVEDNAPFVEIRDNGVGIAEGDLHRIFNPFFTLREKGMGLGLSVTQRILDAHGCKVFVTSQLGQGTTFRVLFPLHFSPPVKAEGVLSV